MSLVLTLFWELFDLHCLHISNRYNIKTRFGLFQACFIVLKIIQLCIFWIIFQTTTHFNEFCLSCIDIRLNWSPKTGIVTIFLKKEFYVNHLFLIRSSTLKYFVYRRKTLHFLSFLLYVWNILFYKDSIFFTYFWQGNSKCFYSHLRGLQNLRCHYVVHVFKEIEKGRIWTGFFSLHFYFKIFPSFLQLI